MVEGSIPSRSISFRVLKKQSMLLWNDVSRPLVASIYASSFSTSQTEPQSSSLYQATDYQTSVIIESHMQVLPILSSRNLPYFSWSSILNVHKPLIVGSQGRNDDILHFSILDQFFLYFLLKVIKTIFSL